MNRTELCLLGIVFGGVACGGLADANKSEAVATLSGSLTATASVPAGAHVALVWRNGTKGGLLVGADSPIKDGRFAISLTGAPADDLFFSPGIATSGWSTSEPPSIGVAEPSTASGGSVPTPSDGTTKTQGSPITEGTTVEGSIASEMLAAAAGFVVYVDANGNGTLDLSGVEASSPDTILGGTNDLVLMFLKGGGALPYEKLRDRAGIAPVAGYNLAWDEGRWLPLNAVEVELKAPMRLSSTVCGQAYAVDDIVPVTVVEKTTPSAGDAAATKHPSKDDPNLICDSDGLGYVLKAEETPTPKVTEGLCAPEYGTFTRGAIPTMRYRVPDGEKVPSDWPCPIPIGTTPDAGLKD